MPYGTIKVDNITFDNGGTDKLLTVSGLFFSTSGALTVTGTISGSNVTAPTATFTTLTGTTTAGTTATFTSGSFTSLTGVTTTVTSGVFGLGSAAAPSIAFSGDTNNGIYSPGTDQVAISTNGTSRIVVDASGNVNIDSSTFYVDAANNRVGIGTTSLSSILEIGGATNGSSLTFSCTSSNPATERLLASLDYKTGGYGPVQMMRAYSVAGISDNGSTLRFYTDSGTSTQQERLRIDQAGRFLVGTSSGTSVGITVGSQYGGINLPGGGGSWANWGGEYGMFPYAGVGLGIATGAAINFVGGSGSNIASINGTTGVYTPLSDARKKKDFEDSSIGLAEVLQLKPKLYRMLDDANDAPKKLGFIAQEVKLLIPQAYVENKITEDDTFIGLQDRPIVAALVKGMQEQQELIIALEGRLSALESA